MLKRSLSSKQQEPKVGKPLDKVGPIKPKASKKKIILISIAIILATAVVAFAGYKFAKSDSKDTKSASSEETKSTAKEAPVEAVVAEVVSPESGEYEVELPADWVTGSCSDNPDIFFLAPTTDLLGKCQTEYFGTVSISKIEGDQRRSEEYYAADDYYRSPAFSEVIIDSLPGYRVSYSIAQESELGYPPVGTFEYTYNLYDEIEDVTYKIGYRELATDSDYQAEFIVIAESFNKL